MESYFALKNVSINMLLNLCENYALILGCFAVMFYVIGKLKHSSAYSFLHFSYPQIVLENIIS